MKRCALILLVVICTCIAACTKKQSPPPPPPPPAFVDSPYLYTSINNFNFATDSISFYSISYPGDSLKESATITASQQIGGVGYTLSFYITNFTGVNTYAISPPGVSATYLVNGNRHYAQSGQITVATDSNNVITGTFNFVADSLTATNGAFNAIL